MNEYRTVVHSDASVFCNSLSELSADGWRVIGFSTDLDEGDEWYNALLERPAPVAPASESDHGQPSGTTGAAQPAASESDVHPSS